MGVFLLDSGLRSSSLAASRRGLATNAELVLAAEESGGGVFTSERLLLPCALGYQLLRTGETPFVPSAVPRQAERSGASLGQQRPLLPGAATAPLSDGHFKHVLYESTQIYMAK